jgi:hypothetical protein
MTESAKTPVSIGADDRTLVVAIRKISDASRSLVKSDLKCRSVIDMASPKRATKACLPNLVWQIRSER